MVKVNVKVDGMMCGMCESHVNDSIRKAFPDAKRVKSSHRKNTASFQVPEAVTEDQVKAAIEDSGYHYVSMEQDA